jgi:hypothetical protein
MVAWLSIHKALPVHSLVFTTWCLKMGTVPWPLALYHFVIVFLIYLLLISSKHLYLSWLSYLYISIWNILHLFTSYIMSFLLICFVLHTKESYTPSELPFNTKTVLILWNLYV